jgi:hypothetical protein
MRIPTRFAALAALALAAVSCSEQGALSPGVTPAPRLAAAALPPVRITEIHYDNAGVDAGEAIRGLPALRHRPRRV